MMKTKFVSDLQVDDELTNEMFLIQEMSQRTTRDGRPYLLATLQDRSGEVGAVFWNVPDYIITWAKIGAPVLVTGRVVMYKEAHQINITDMNPAPSPDLTLLLPSSQRAPEEMIAELRERIGGLSDPWQKLVASLLLDDDFLPQFAAAPAARNMHHAYIGGLLEHSLSMAAIAESLATHYDYVNKDLLMAGVLLHDMGKTLEYEISGAFTRSDDGRLVGHITRAAIMVETAAAQLDFPPDQLRDLIHLIVSHHGTNEWGSPTRPKTLEGILLHQIDLLDSRVQGYLDHVRDDAGAGPWTLKRNPMFGSTMRYPEGWEVVDSG